MTSKSDKEELTPELEALVSKKEMYFAKIQRTYDYIKQLDDPTILSNFKAEYHSIENVMKTFTVLIDQINVLSRKLNPKYKFNYSAVDSAEQLYGHIREAYLDLSKISHNEGNILVPPASVPKLPKIDLMEFHGDKRQWPLFIETFNSLVDNNPNLDDITKVHYLLSSLKGPAQALCSSVLPTASNYRILLHTLKERYEDKRLLANIYLSQMLEFKSAQTESLSSLTAFLDKFDIAVNALKNLKLTDLLDYTFVYLGLSKIDSQTHKYFEMQRDSATFPTYSELIEFIKNQIKSLNHSAKHHSISKSVPKTRPPVQTYVTSCQSKNNCALCDQNHLIFQCNRFDKLKPADRYKIVKDKRLCLNCLSDKHKVVNCKSKNVCRYCRRTHHSMLHFENNKQLETSLEGQNTEIVDSPASDNIALAVSESRQGCKEITLLSTAVVKVYSSSGVFTTGRFLIDTASQSHFLTTHFCKRLGVNISAKQLTVLGIGGCSQSVRGSADVIIVSRFNSVARFKISALVVDKITEMLPSANVRLDVLAFLKDIPLADSEFYKPGAIDGILGADLFPRILGSGRLQGDIGSPVAVETSLGYVVMGKVQIVESSGEYSRTFCSTLIHECSLETIMRKFWETEEVENSVVLSPDDATCERLYKETTSRDISGRYCVGLPFRGDMPALGDSSSMAMKRFLALENRLYADKGLKEMYFSAFQDYLDQDHMVYLGSFDDFRFNFGYFVPHFPVIKDSISTPLRIVFDSSAKTSNSVSLNDELLSGVKLQTDILRILLDFRLFKIAMVSDIRQMYRNIFLRNEDRKYQRILWRSSSGQSVSVYEMTRVSFGLKTAPYLALRTVQQLACDEGHRFPVASKCVMSDLYVDDVVTSVPSIEEAKVLSSQLVSLFNAGGFELVKWSSNSPEVLNHIPEPLRLTRDVIFDNSDSVNDFTKVLGLQWSPGSDVFYFKVNVPARIECTKRKYLSTIARIWDPVGFLVASDLNCEPSY